jgi:predicted pyridoxine 5'-phosphate oxidase superfamily flavin-nucleotide-binding protein
MQVDEIDGPWHAGEREVQRRVGEVEQADRTSGGIRHAVPPAAVEFLTEQPMLVIASTTADGLVWTSLIVGPPGFLRVPRPDTLAIDARLPPGDPLATTLTATALVGTLAIEPLTRRRSRLNGRSWPTERGYEVDLHQVFANCPKYIQRRGLLPLDRRRAGLPVVNDVLLPHHQHQMATADSFFIGTTDAVGNADASHRGGNPGFVEVLGADRFRFLDYQGNSMYMTLGNLEQQPAAGFLFVEWDTGTTLQITGNAHVIYSTERVVEVAVRHAIETRGASPLRWSRPTPSRYNPPTDRTSDPTQGS